MLFELGSIFLASLQILPLIRHIGFLVLIIPLTLLFGAVLTSDCSIPVSVC